MTRKKSSKWCGHDAISMSGRWWINDVIEKIAEAEEREGHGDTSGAILCLERALGSSKSGAREIYAAIERLEQRQGGGTDG